jgi:hypothetical protein
VITIAKKNPKLTEMVQVIADQVGIKTAVSNPPKGKEFVYDFWLELEGHRLSKKTLEKYTKLIVQECARITEVYGDSRARECVLEHFGIE